MSQDRILVVEDEEHILMALEDDLRLEGYVVDSATDGASGLALAESGTYDLIILDVMLPKLDGMEVCRQLRSQSVSTPLLMLTAKSQEIDKVLGLELGADDYVTKPFSPRELVARIKAILRRGRQPAQSVQHFRFGDTEVDFRKYATRRAGRPVELTEREYALLQYLIEHRDEAVSRDSVLRAVWGDTADVFPRTVDTHVANLRKKLEPDPSRPRHIIGVRGIGYRFAE
jgi:DNA-binding response OmpR family regulator